jgi:hypothetical protein
VSLLLWYQIRLQPDSSLGIKLAAQIIVAADEYSRARDVLATVHQDNSVFFADYNESLARIETCILALDRAMRIAKQLRERGTLPPGVWEMLPPNRARRRISNLRNRIEHADKEVPHEKWPEFEYLFLYGSRDELEIADQRVSWKELGRWIDASTKAVRRLLSSPQGTESAQPT